MGCSAVGQSLILCPLLYLSEGPNSLFHPLHFDRFLRRQFSPHLALWGGRRAFCHGPKETGGVQVSILSMDFTQGACPRGGTLSSYWNPTGRRKDDSRQGNEETMAAAIYWKGFTPSVCWSSLPLFVLIEKRREVSHWETGFFLEWSLWVQLKWELPVTQPAYTCKTFWKRWWHLCSLCWYAKEHTLITVLISLSLPFLSHVFTQDYCKYSSLSHPSFSSRSVLNCRLS